MGICGSKTSLSDPGEVVMPPDELKQTAVQVGFAESHCRIPDTFMLADMLEVS